MDLEVLSDKPRTEVGSYFVANYPPFSTWTAEHVPQVVEALQSQRPGSSGSSHVEATPLEKSVPHPDPRVPGSGMGHPASAASSLGLYLHIPFCRKRCKFCYFRVYTDKNSSDVDVYLEALAREMAIYAQQPALQGREFEFVYFGGGTPSFLSAEQLTGFIDEVRKHWSWEQAREVTFECEPGTLKEAKLEAIKSIGTTRLSLGIEHFDDEILEINGRAHHSPEIYRAYEWARRIGFDQINIDLIAGMVGDDDDKWQDAVAKALALAPDSVTIYQMELPHNTVISREAMASGQAAPVADWNTKRRWVDHAFTEFEKAGYVVSSGYTLVKPSRNGRFVYRDALWHGGDMIGTGVASFSHFAGFHFQNVDRWEDYLGSLQSGQLPLARALATTAHQRLVRELVLQLKLGRLDFAYFREKFGINVMVEFAEAFNAMVEDGFGQLNDQGFRLTRSGLLRVDALLPRFFETQFRNVRYT